MYRSMELVFTCTDVPDFPGLLYNIPRPPSQPTKRDKVVLYYGARNADQMAYADQLNDWKEAGVAVVPVMSEDGNGYVQDVFKAVCAVGGGVCMSMALL